MIIFRKFHFVLSVLALFISSLPAAGQEESLKMRGITVVAPPEPIGIPEMEAVKDVNANWISLVPYGFAKKKSTDIRYNLDWQWWGERKEGIVASIHLAHENGFKVMLKPQVYIHGHWVGDVEFETEEEWLLWEKSYKEYIHFYAKIASENRVDLFCVGTEYKKAAQQRPEFWIDLISEIRTYFDGEIIYSSNWDGYNTIKIWESVDYIGLSAYFPLTDTKTPTLNILKRKWRPIKKKLAKFAKKYKKKIIFTEFGYQSIDRCAWKAWELEKNIKSKPINEKAQANAYEALLKTFWKEEWWGGGFLWKWFPRGMGHEGYPERDYTPQGKIAEQVIREIYGK